MKRLTHIDHIGWYIEDQRVAFDGRRRGWDVDRLAAYEDTGLEPKEVTAIKNSIMGQEIVKITEFDGIPIRRLQELAQAEKDGRLVVLQKTPLDADALREIVEDGLRNNPHKDGYARVCHRSEYTHFLDVIQRMPTIATSPNAPLSMEELREMDGEPVFCFSKRAAEDSAYGIACIRDNIPYVRTIQNKGTSSRFFYLTTYGTAWLAYRHKPEEGGSG